MTKARSLHVGLNVVDASHYGGTHPLSGCHNDARDMAAIARSRGYDSTVLLDGDATAARVLDEMKVAAGTLASGDAFMLSYAGHGAQVPDDTGDEADALDETWLLFDRMLLDDEIYAALARFEAGVRVLVISDSCHSGSVARRMQYERLVREGPMASEYADTTRQFRTPADPELGKRVWTQHAGIYQPIARGLPGNQRALVRAAIIQLSGCQDDQLSADGPGNGLFTSKLKQVWASGDFRGNHRAFSQAVRAAMPPTQSPNYLTFGQNVSEFESEQPFTVTVPKASTNVCEKKGSDLMNENSIDDGNWSEVRAELEGRFPGWKPPEGARGANVLATSGHSAYVGVPVVAAEGASGSRSLDASRAASGPPIVRTYWWGFTIEISSQDLQGFLSVAEPINAIAATLGPVAGPAAPYILAASAFIAGALQLLRSLDQGNGVYISMSWFAVGVFVPGTSRGRGLASVQTRGPGEPYEQAGYLPPRSYGGGLFGLRLEDDIYWNLPDGTIRDHVIVNMNPPGFGNVYFNGWLSNDPTVGHFRLHVGVASFRGGNVELRMMIRDAPGRRSTTTGAPGPRALTAAEL